MNDDFLIFVSKSLKYFSKNVLFPCFFTIFAFRNLGLTMPKCMSLNDLVNGIILLKVIQQCYNRRKQSLEGSRKAV